MFQIPLLCIWTTWNQSLNCQPMGRPNNDLLRTVTSFAEMNVAVTTLYSPKARHWKSSGNAIAKLVKEQERDQSELTALSHSFSWEFSFEHESNDPYKTSIMWNLLLEINRCIKCNSPTGNFCIMNTRFSLESIKYAFVLTRIKGREWVGVSPEHI